MDFDYTEQVGTKVVRRSIGKTKRRDDIPPFSLSPPTMNGRA
jgi:hypothetical protein